MLNAEDNALLTRVGPNTPMGEYLRRYWVPALLSEEVPVPDCPPARVRILGESLIAFRDTDGRVGLLDNFCPHRRASLFFGRNEECGLRCVYHGWKFDVNGDCVDMPSEPAESNFKDKVRITAYPCEERGGVVWAYMGPPDLKPELPNLAWAACPDEQSLPLQVPAGLQLAPGARGRHRLQPHQLPPQQPQARRLRPQRVQPGAAERRPA